MKISVLTSDLSNNCLGRAWLLGKILQRKYEIEIIGPIFGQSIWVPVRGEFPYVSVNGAFFPKFIPHVCKLLTKIEGDVIYASKPLFTSFTVGLLKKYVSKVPIVLDIDDWEVSLCLKYVGKRNVLDPNSYWMALLNEKLVCLADDITVSNRFLQAKFGGTLIYHARDTEYFNPDDYDVRGLKQQFGVGGKKVVGFLGTARPHKGLEELIRAVAMLRDEGVVLMVVGLGKDAYSQNVRKMMQETLAGQRFLDFGVQSVQDLPKFLSITDVVVIPQRRTLESVGQVPAKVFDAMAMAKPIISTKVSDLPEILTDCGWIVDPEKPMQLSEAIGEVFDDFEYAQRVGRKAREKCVREYSYNAMEKRLAGIFNKF